MARYTLHMELDDSTLEPAFTRYKNKRLAIRMARLLAKHPSFMAVRLIVNDSDEMTVAAFTLPAA